MVKSLIVLYLDVRTLPRPQLYVPLRVPLRGGPHQGQPQLSQSRVSPAPTPSPHRPSERGNSFKEISILIIVIRLYLFPAPTYLMR